MHRCCNRGFSLVELMIVVVIIGILASLASFGFMQYVRKSKTGEAYEYLTHFRNASQAYFSSEQVYGGEERFWHIPGGRGKEVGMPVPFAGRVFPGGSKWIFSTHSTPPKGGTKEKGDNLIKAMNGADSIDRSALKKLQYLNQEPTYFSYSYDSSGAGQSATATIKAIADFAPGTKENHTVTQVIKVGERGELSISNPFVSNENE